MNIIQELRNKLKKELKSSQTHFESVEMGFSEVPCVVEKRGVDWVSYGDDNLFPMKLSDLKYGSGSHNAIISTAADMISGDGYLIDGAKTKEESELKYNALPVEIKTAYDLFLKNPNGGMSLEKVKKKLSFDVKEQGAYCYEVIYNNDFTKIPVIKYVDIKNIRPGKKVNDKVESYWYSRDWSKPNHKDYKPTEIFAYDIEDKEHMNQLVFDKVGNLEYFGVPDYIGGVRWVYIDMLMGIFHHSNIENGMNPSMKFQFYKLPSSEQDKQNILTEIKRRYTGASKTGRHMVFFSEGKELAPLIEPIPVSGLDKQLLLLAELCDKKILTAHKLTSPLLAGISIAGQLGGNTEIEKAFKIYDKTRIEPYRKMIDESIQDKLDFNKIGVKIKTNPFNPFE